MKLAFSAWAMPRRPVAEQIAIVRDCGYAAIELVSSPNAALDALEATAAERRSIRQQLDAAGLELPSIAGHANMLEPDPERRAASVARVRAGIDLAADLAGPSGPPCLVAMGYGQPDRYVEQRGQLVDAFGELARHGAARGVVVALEPHVGQAIDLPERVAWLVEAVGSPHFRLNFDNSHFEVMGRSIESYLPLLAPYSVHTHLKDQAGRSPEHQFLVPGEGEFNYPRFLRAIEPAGYRGAITVEISVMVQRRPDYDPAEVARRSFAVLTAAANAAGVALETRDGR
ncbi:MAG TPA: sugar phosphate isomerase/epimerase family protein [Chloroflexota bacterium]